MSSRLLMKNPAKSRRRKSTPIFLVFQNNLLWVIIKVLDSGAYAQVNEFEAFTIKIFRKKTGCKKLVCQSWGTFRVFVESGLKSREQEDTCRCHFLGFKPKIFENFCCRLAVHTLRRAQFKISGEKKVRSL